jgi:integrase
MKNQEREEYMRRSKGEGAIYRRKTGAKKGLWVAEYKVGNKKKYLYGKTKKAVTDKLRAMLSSEEADLAPEADNMSVDDYLDRWLPTVRGTVKERTWTRHEEVVRLHLKPSIGGIKLLKLNALDVQELYLSKLKSGLSPRTVQIIHTTLHKALKQAVMWSLVSKNVAQAVIPPKPQKKEIRVLTSEETKRLLRAARGDTLEALYILAVTTGMRQGELLGLKWDDIDLNEGTLRVRRTLWEGKTTPPKTPKANRSIRLTKIAKDALRKHLKRANGSEWVFSTKSGTPTNCHNLTKRSWWPLLKKTGLPKIPFHNLRHTAATLLLSQSVHPKLVQELLGHADIATTLDTYSHVIPSMGGRTASAMEDLLEDSEE